MPVPAAPPVNIRQLPSVKIGVTPVGGTFSRMNHATVKRPPRSPVKPVSTVVPARRAEPKRPAVQCVPDARFSVASARAPPSIPAALISSAPVPRSKR
jgi:hypothetical protein